MLMPDTMGAPIERQVMVHPGDHVKNPLGAKLEKGHFQVGIAVEHAMTDDRHEGKLRRQRHADDVAVVDRAAELRKRRIAHAHVHAERQLGARKLIPHGQETRIGKQALARGAEDDGGARAEPLHFLERRERFALVAQRQQARPI